MAVRVAVYAMPTSPAGIGMPVIDAGVEAAVGLGAGGGCRLGVGGTGVLVAVGLDNVHETSKTDPRPASRRALARATESRVPAS